MALRAIVRLFVRINRERRVVALVLSFGIAFMLSLQFDANRTHHARAVAGMEWRAWVIVAAYAALRRTLPRRVSVDIFLSRWTVEECYA